MYESQKTSKLPNYTLNNTHADQIPACSGYNSDSEGMVDIFGNWDIYGIIPENTFDLHHFAVAHNLIKGFGASH